MPLILYQMFITNILKKLDNYNWLGSNLKYSAWLSQEKMYIVNRIILEEKAGKIDKRELGGKYFVECNY